MKGDAAKIFLEGEERYRSTLDSMLEGCQIIGHDWRYLYVNAAAATHGRRTKEQLLGHTMMECYPGIEKTAMFAALRRCMDERVPQRMENEFTYPNGAKAWFELSIQPVPEGIFILSLDVTRRKQAGDALRESEQKLQLFVEHAPAALAMFDREMRYLAVSQRWMADYGLTERGIVGRSHYEIFPEIPARWKAAHRRGLAGEVVRADEDDFVRADGTVQWLRWEVRPWYVADGAVGGIVIFTEDISARKQAEAEREQLLAQIQAQARQVQQIMDTVPEGVLLLDASGRVLLANPAAERDMAALAEVRIGDRLTRLGDRPLAELLTSPPTKGLWHEVQAGTQLFEVIARPATNGPQPERWVLVLHDATQERQVREQLQQQERLAAIGQLAAGIAHDFNNIMAVIVLYTQIALNASPDITPQSRERLTTVSQQAKRAGELIQQVLDFSRRAVIERQPLDLLPLLKEQVKLLQRTLPENIQIELAPVAAGTAFTVQADVTRMQQVVMNLALNARDALLPQGGGQLRISIERVRFAEGDKLPLLELTPGEWVRLSVADTGTGIPADVLPHIFEPFFTTKPTGEGTGLGLAQVYGIVKQHEGEIQVHTEPGAGTTFTIYLPEFSAAPAAMSIGDKKELVRGQGERILVVEDDVTTRETLANTLEVLNYRPLKATNGYEALEMLEREPEIALVISDVVMPAMGGVALFHALREKHPRMPMMLLTGHLMGSELEGLRGLGLKGWISKPPDLKQLTQMIARSLNNRG